MKEKRIKIILEATHQIISELEKIIDEDRLGIETDLAYREYDKQANEYYKQLELDELENEEMIARSEMHEKLIDNLFFAFEFHDERNFLYGENKSKMNFIEKRKFLKEMKRMVLVCAEETPYISEPELLITATKRTKLLLGIDNEPNYYNINVSGLLENHDGELVVTKKGQKVIRRGDK